MRIGKRTGIELEVEGRCPECGTNDPILLFRKKQAEDNDWCHCEHCFFIGRLKITQDRVYIEWTGEYLSWNITRTMVHARSR